MTDVVCLLEAPEMRKFRVADFFPRLEEHGIAWHHFPVPDGLPPSIAQLEAALRLLRRMLRQGRVVLVHCYGGLGRTGVVAACLLLSVDEVNLTKNKYCPFLKIFLLSRIQHTVLYYYFLSSNVVLFISCLRKSYVQYFFKVIRTNFGRSSWVGATKIPP